LSENEQEATLDMGVLYNRIILVRRYNEAMGAPGPAVEQLQQDFVEQTMRAEFVESFVDQCEFTIAARSTMHPNETGTNADHSRQPYNTIPSEKPD
jgi:hypothetical protein